MRVQRLVGVEGVAGVVGSEGGGDSKAAKAVVEKVVRRAGKRSRT